MAQASTCECKCSECWLAKKVTSSSPLLLFHREPLVTSPPNTQHPSSPLPPPPAQHTHDLLTQRAASTRRGQTAMRQRDRRHRTVPLSTARYATRGPLQQGDGWMGGEGVKMQWVQRCKGVRDGWERGGGIRLRCTCFCCVASQGEPQGRERQRARQRQRQTDRERGQDRQTKRQRQRQRQRDGTYTAACPTICTATDATRDSNLVIALTKSGGSA